MAQVHVAYVGMVRVKPGGGVIKKQSTIQENLSFETQHRVIEDNTIPNTANNPTLKDYLELEVADGFIPNHIDQYVVVTLKP
jgi:hypothetical protein